MRVGEYQGLFWVEIMGAEGECAGAATGGFGVEPEDESVEGWVVAGGGGDVVDLIESVVGDCRRVEGSRRGLGTLRAGCRLR